jgi:hypothetical protein
MSRRVLCAACDSPLDLDAANTLHLTLKSPPRDGVPTPDISVTADLCSPRCLREWIESRAVAELHAQLERWVRVGAIRVEPRRRALPAPESIVEEAATNAKREPFNPLTFPVPSPRKRGER